MSGCNFRLCGLYSIFCSSLSGCTSVAFFVLYTHTHTHTYMRKQNGSFYAIRNLVKQETQRVRSSYRTDIPTFLSIGMLLPAAWFRDAPTQLATSQHISFQTKSYTTSTNNWAHIGAYKPGHTSHTGRQERNC
jgi:hypothetical protein